MPSFSAVRNAFEATVRDGYNFVAQCRQNFEARYALWGGQSADGKKHARTGADPEPVPWDGASDLKVFLIDQAINDKVAMNCMAFRKANLVANPIVGQDIVRARDVSNFMRWLLYTQIPEVDREMELLNQFIYEKGVAVTGQFWELSQEKTLDTLNLKDFAAKFPGVDLVAHLNDPVMAEQLANILVEFYKDISLSKAKAMVRDLRDTGTATVPVLGAVRSYPIIRAFNLDEDIFIPPYTTDIEQAPHIFRVQYFTPEKLRSFVHTDGWDADWVEAAIDRLRGRMIPLVPDQNQAPLSRNFIYRYQRYNDLVGVVYAYQRLSDEDGVPGIYLTIFNPLLPDDAILSGFAKHQLLGYRHGQYPFVLHRREYLTRRIHDSRGLPEPGLPAQNQIKAHRDGRIDAASIAIIPPLAYPAGRAPTRWGPGAKVPERRQGEYHYLDKPTGDINTETSEKILLSDWKEYAGLANPEGDPVARDLLNQHQVNKFLTGISKAMGQIWKLYQQFGDDAVYYRVLGQGSQNAQRFQKGSPEECYDFFFSYDVQMQNPENVEKKFAQVLQLCMTADKFGQVDYGQLLQIGVSLVDPTWAETIIKPRAAAQAQVVQEEKNALARIFAGFPEDITIGTPPDIGLQVMQQWLQMPDVRQRYQADETFQERVNTRAKQYQMQMQQQTNQHTGRFGATFGQGSNIPNIAPPAPQ